MLILLSIGMFGDAYLIYDEFIMLTLLNDSHKKVNQPINTL